MGDEPKRKRNWPTKLIAAWLVLNGVLGLVAQVLRVLGVDIYSVPVIDRGFEAMDTGVVLMDIFIANPVHILGGVLLWRRHRWGLVLSVAGLLIMTYSVLMFAVAFTQLGAWDKVSPDDIGFIAIMLPINLISLTYLLLRFRGGRLDDA